MHEEMRAVAGDVDFKIITYRVSPYPRRAPFPYEVIRYEDACLVYDPLEKIDRGFGSPSQQLFLERVGEAIERFQPDVLHAHYFGLALLLENLAQRHRTPFTVRTHSFDVLSEPPERIAALCEAANSPWCLRLLAYPAFRNQLIQAGLQPEKVVSSWPVITFRRFYRPERRSPTGRIMCAGPAIPKKAHREFVDLAASMRESGLRFDLFARGGSDLAKTRAYNESLGNPVQITYADPDDMQDIYPLYDWLVYPADRNINKVGLPVAIAEAQAAGVGVCWQELPGRRAEQLEFLADAGYLFQSIEEVPPIIAKPYPEKMRLRGLENARKCDIEGHVGLLTKVWAKAASRRPRWPSADVLAPPVATPRPPPPSLDVLALPDQKWIEVASFLRREGREGDVAVAPEEFYYLCEHITCEFLPRDPMKVLQPEAIAVLHKGRLAQQPKVALAALLSLAPIFANEVFVLFSKTGKSIAADVEVHIGPVKEAIAA
jgi:hypothetical protein